MYSRRCTSSAARQRNTRHDMLQRYIYMPCCRYGHTLPDAAHATAIIDAVDIDVATPPLMMPLIFLSMLTPFSSYAAGHFRCRDTMPPC